MDICALLDAAKSHSGIKNDRQLGLRLGLDATAINCWRKARSKPNDNNLIAIAKLAGVDPLPLLIELNMLRSEGEAASIYGELLARLNESEGLVAAE